MLDFLEAFEAITEAQEVQETLMVQNGVELVEYFDVQNGGYTWEVLHDCAVAVCYDFQDASDTFARWVALVERA